MALYEAVDPKTGRKVSIVRDMPPTEADLEAVFARVQTMTVYHPAQYPTWMFAEVAAIRSLTGIIHARFQRVLGLEASPSEMGLIMALVVSGQLDILNIEQAMLEMYPEASLIRSALHDCWWN